MVKTTQGQILLQGTVIPFIVELSKLKNIFVSSAIHLFNDVFKTDSLQFGFKEGCSTTMCSAMMKEIAHSFNAKGSNMYAVLLGTTKAFNCVELAKMFLILLDKRMNAAYVRYLFFMYSQQKLHSKKKCCYFNTKSIILTPK